MTRPTRSGGFARTLALGCVLVAAPIGCGNQYADVGSIDVSASKEAAAKNGITKGQPRSGRAAGPGQAAGKSSPPR